MTYTLTGTGCYQLQRDTYAAKPQVLAVPESATS